MGILSIPGGPPGPDLPAVASGLQAALRKALGFEVRVLARRERKVPTRMLLVAAQQL